MEVKTVYTSSDGFEFSSEEKCREHEENKIKMEKQKKEMRAIYNEALQYSPEDFERKQAFKIKSKDEFNIIMSVLGADEVVGEYEENVVCYMVETDYDSYDDKLTANVMPLSNYVLGLKLYIQAYEDIFKESK